MGGEFLDNGAFFPLLHENRYIIAQTVQCCKSKA
jgi:hypothetical protein